MRILLFCCLCLPLVLRADPVQQVLDSYYSQGLIPGGSVAWISSQGDLTTRVIGMADSDLGVPMTAQSRMLSASIGKSYISAALLKAVEAQKLAIDRPIRYWLGHYPWFEHLPNADEITLRQLLNHTSGLPDHVYQPEFAPAFSRLLLTGDFLNEEQSIAMVLGQPALFPAGQGWAYSDTGYLLAGLILEEVFRQPWSETITEMFIKPLELKNTEPSDKRTLTGLAVGYTSADNPLGLPMRTQSKDGTLIWHPATEGAGGGWVTTPSDLVRWGRKLWSGDLFPPEIMTLMLSGVDIAPGQDTRYGLGVVMESTADLGAVRRHSGWIPGYVSSLRHYPEKGLTVAIQINSDVNMSGPDGIFPALEQALITAIIETVSETH